MDGSLQRLLKKHHLELAYLPIEGPGYLVKGKNGKPDQIIVSSSLPDEKVENVVLHEIGHREKDSDVIGDYKANYKVRTISEHGANAYMIRERVKQYVALGNDAASSNYVDLANMIGTNEFGEVKKELGKYLIN